jgi:hypothetical protein
MASKTGASLHADPGPVDADDVDCTHSGSTFPNDPPPAFTTPCDQPAVFRVELPDTLGTVAFCPFHLARWTLAFDDPAETYREEFGHIFRRAQPDPDRRWLVLSDLPPATHGDGHTWRRVGLDQRGHAHYYRTHPDGYRLLTFAPGWDVEDLRVEREPLDAVGTTVGWVDLDPDAVDALSGGGRRGD